MLEETYHETLFDRLGQLEDQWPAVASAGLAIADKVGEGGKLYVYERTGAVSSELCSRAGGLVVTRGLEAEGEGGLDELAESGELGDGDITLFFSYRADDDGDLACASKIRDTGAFLIVICPFEAEIPSGSALLKEVGDIAIDTASGDAVGAVDVPGLAVRVCPTSGIIDVMAAYAVLGSFVSTMVARGKPPSVYKAIHLKGGGDYNRASRERFEDVGY